MACFWFFLSFYSWSDFWSFFYFFLANLTRQTDRPRKDPLPRRDPEHDRTNLDRTPADGTRNTLCVSGDHLRQTVRSPIWTYSQATATCCSGSGPALLSVRSWGSLTSRFFYKNVCSKKMKTNCHFLRNSTSFLKIQNWFSLSKLYGSKQTVRISRSGQWCPREFRFWVVLEPLRSIRGSAPWW